MNNCYNCFYRDEVILYSETGLPVRAEMHCMNNRLYPLTVIDPNKYCRFWARELHLRTGDGEREETKMKCTPLQAFNDVTC